MQVLVIEPDAVAARAIARVAFETLAHEPTILVGAASTVDAAKQMIAMTRQAGPARLIVLCATRLEDGGSGLEVVDYARSHPDPDVRVVLLTNGERDEIVDALRYGVHGIVGRPVEVKGLRQIIGFLSRSDLASPIVAMGGGEDATLAEAHAALERALDAVEVAHERLRRAGDRAPPAMREALRDAERLAVDGHRRVLEAERKLRERAPEA